MRLLLLLLVTIPSAVVAGEPRTIPFNEVFAIIPQEGMNAAKSSRNADGLPTAPHGESLQRLLRRFKNAGSNLFIVQGETDVEAMGASERAFNGLSADRPIAQLNYDPKGTHWMVAYLGIGSSTPVYKIESITQESNRIRITYCKPNPLSATADVRRYLYWIKLGELKAGEYELELFDSDSDKVMLMRRVEVGPRQR